MQVNNSFSCCKPRKRFTFQGQKTNPLENRKVRYKHYEEMSDDHLMIHSISKAYKNVNKSGKMHLYKAIPAIATGIVAASLAISQPGKLSTKASRGLGFLVLAQIAGKAINFSNKIVDESIKEDKPSLKKPLLKTLGAIGATAGAGLAIFGTFTAGKNILNRINPNINKFFNSELTQLANEINKTKFGNYVENTLNPFVQKHQTKFKIAAELSPFFAVLGAVKAQDKLSKSLTKDIESKTAKNFLNAKQIQQSAKAHFNSIDAQEV